MRTRELAVPLAIAALALASATSATATAASLNCAQAKKAVKRELMRTKLDSSKTSEVRELSCQRLGRTRAKVYWRAWSKLDISQGNVSGRRGYATAQRYAYGIDVTIFTTN